MDNLELAHHGLREEERAILRAALAAIEGISEVGAIDRGAEGAGTLAIDDQSGGVQARAALPRPAVRTG